MHFCDIIREFNLLFVKPFFFAANKIKQADARGRESEKGRDEETVMARYR